MTAATQSEEHRFDAIKFERLWWSSSSSSTIHGLSPYLSAGYPAREGSPPIYRTASQLEDNLHSPSTSLSTMTKLTYADAVAIYELVFYSPALIFSIFVAGKHGAMKSSGWVFLTIFCIIRIVGSAARITTITNPTSNDAYTIALICSVLSLSPLLMASLGLISRA